jgi:hypothetical protein
MRASSTQSIRKIPTSRCKTVFECSGYLSGFFWGGGGGFLLLLGNFSLVFCSVCMCVCEVSFFSPFFLYARIGVRSLVVESLGICGLLLVRWVLKLRVFYV